MDERMIEAVLEAEASHINPPPDLLAKIRMGTKGQRRGGLSWWYRLPATKWVAGIAVSILVTAVVMNAWMATPTLAAALTLSPRDSTTLLSMGTGGLAKAVELPVDVDSYSAMYYRWSPDGRHLVYGMKGDLFIYDAETREARNLTKSPTRWELMPTWSPQGDKIAFVSRPLEPGEAQPTKPGAGAWVMQGCFCGSPTIIGWDGSGYRVVEEGMSSNPPTWSTDGTMLAYELGGQVHLYDLGKEQVTALDVTDYGLDAKYLGAPAWSPTRKEVAVFFSQGDRSPTREKLMAGKAEKVKQGYAVLDLDRQQARIVYQYEAPFTPRPPALWSSDGNRLALLLKEELLVAKPTGLIVVDREGRKSEVVAERVYQAEWEPGGQRLAYIDADDPRNIRILSPANAGWVARTLKSTVYLQGFAWRPDGR